MAKGKVVRWNADKGFGFVRLEDGREVFLHVSDVEPKQPRGVDLGGQKVEIHRVSNDSKGPRVVSATIAGYRERLRQDALKAGTVRPALNWAMSAIMADWHIAQLEEAARRLGWAVRASSAHHLAIERDGVGVVVAAPRLEDNAPYGIGGCWVARSLEAPPGIRKIYLEGDTVARKVHQARGVDEERGLVLCLLQPEVWLEQVLPEAREGRPEIGWENFQLLRNLASRESAGVNVKLHLYAARWDGERLTFPLYVQGVCYKISAPPSEVEEEVEALVREHKGDRLRRNLFDGPIPSRSFRER